jgi:hypothetical protein
VAPRLPGGEDPLDGLARVHGLPRRRREEPVVKEQAPEPPPASRADAPAWHAAGAAVLDSLLLVAVNAAVWALTSAALGVAPAVALEQAAPALFMLWTLITGIYFVLLGGIRNSTPGMALLAPRAPRGTARGLTLGSSVVRGLRCAFEESSITVQWLVGSAQGQQWLRTLRQLRA